MMGVSAEALAVLAALGEDQRRALATLLSPQQQPPAPAQGVQVSAPWTPELRFMSARGKEGDTITQTWENILDYYPLSMWRQESENEGLRQTDLIQKWTEQPLRMGLRHPSEGTRAMMVTGFLLANPRKAASMNSFQRSALMDLVKDPFVTAVRKEGRQKCLVHLPRDPAELRRHEETKHIVVESDDPPVQCPFTDSDVRTMRNTFRLRKTKNCVSQSAVSNQPAPDAMVQQMQFMQSIKS